MTVALAFAASAIAAAAEGDCIERGQTRGVAIVDARTVLFDAGDLAYRLVLAEDCAALVGQSQLQLYSTHDDQRWCARQGDALLVGETLCEPATIQTIAAATFARTVAELRDAQAARPMAPVEVEAPRSKGFYSSASCFSPNNVVSFNEDSDDGLIVSLRDRTRFRLRLKSSCPGLAHINGVYFVSAFGTLICGNPGDAVLLQDEAGGALGFPGVLAAGGQSRCPIAGVERVDSDAAKVR